MHLRTAFLVAATAAAFSVQANDLRTGVGGAVGGAGGAAVGSHVGGSTGAIIGGAAGGAVGGAVGATGNAKTGAAIGGAIGGGAGAAIGNEVGGTKGAVIGAGVGGAAGAVIGGSMTADPAKPQTKTQAPAPVGMASVPAAGGPAGYSCNRNNPGKGRALGHCKQAMKGM
jgi:hypothetical protein